MPAKELKEKNSEGDSHARLQRLIERNSELLEENNTLLKKMHRTGLIAFWLRIFWYTLIIGLPFLLYFYVIEPYFEVIGANYEVFKAGVSEIPGLKGIENVLDSLGRN